MPNEDAKMTRFSSGRKVLSGLRSLVLLMIILPLKIVIVDIFL